MSWQTAVVAAIGVAQYQQQGAIGKYNQAVANRNANVAEQEAAIIEDRIVADGVYSSNTVLGSVGLTYRFGQK